MLRSLTIMLLSAYTVHSAHKDRAERLNRMKQYETASLSPMDGENEHKMTLSFDAFDQHYEVELWREIQKAPSNVRHTNVRPEVHGPISSIKESCHWQGRVVNYEGTSVVSASLCEGMTLYRHHFLETSYIALILIQRANSGQDVESDPELVHSMRF